jgi:hypothetical protein
MSESTEMSAFSTSFRKAVCYGYICGIPLGLIYLYGFWGFPEICVEWDTDARRADNVQLMICFYIQIGVLLLLGSNSLVICNIRRNLWKDDDSFVSLLWEMVSWAVGLTVWFVPGILIFINLSLILANCNEFNSWLLALAISDFLLLTVLGTFVLAVVICSIMILVAYIFLLLKDICGGFLPTKPDYDILKEKEQEEKV